MSKAHGAGGALPDASAPPGRLFFPALVAVIALGPMSIQIFLPALPAIQTAFGVSTGRAQLALSVSMLAIAGAMLVYGPLSDRFGRRPVLLLGQLVFLAGSVACAFAGSVTALVLGRALQAAGGASGTVLSRAIVNDAVPARRVSSVLAYLAVAMAVVPMLAPSLGGLLIEASGWRAIFVLASAVGAVALGLAAMGIHETRVAVAPRSGGFARLLRTPAFLAYAFQGAFASGCFFAFISAVPYLMIQGLGRSAFEYGLWFMAVSVVFMGGSLVAARVSEAAGHARMARLGSGCLVASALLLWLTAGQGASHPLAYFGPGMLLALGQGLGIPNSQAGAVAAAPDLAGAAAGLASFLQMFVAAVFAQLVGTLGDGTPTPMIACVAAAALASLASIAALPR